MESNSEANAIAVREVRKLASMQDYAKDQEDALDMIVETLIEHAEDPSHISRIVNTWIYRTRQMLHPADIPALANETSSDAKRRRQTFGLSSFETFKGFKVN